MRIRGLDRKEFFLFVILGFSIVCFYSIIGFDLGYFRLWGSREFLFLRVVCKVEIFFRDMIF